MWMPSDPAQRKEWLAKYNEAARKRFPYDCDEVRARCARRVEELGSKSALLRELGAAAGKDFQGVQLNTFLSRKGPREGLDLGIYQAAVELFKREDGAAAAGGGAAATGAGAGAGAAAAGGVAAAGAAAAGAPAAAAGPAPPAASSAADRAERAAAFERLCAEVDAAFDAHEDVAAAAGKAPPTCGAVRRRLTEFLATGPTQTALLKRLGVNSNSYGRFMSYKGDSGRDNGTYERAVQFFARVDALKRPAKKARK